MVLCGEWHDAGQTRGLPAGGEPDQHSAHGRGLDRGSRFCGSGNLRRHDPPFPENAHLVLVRS